jgi:hypothetical protein
MTRYTPLWLQAGSYPAGTDRRLISAIWPAAVVNGCAVTVASNMNLNVSAGWVVVPAANSSGSVLCTSDAVEVVTLGTAPGAGTNRIDVVVCSAASTDIGTAAGDAFSFTAVAGTPSASPVAPTVPAGSVAIAQVLVLGGQATIQAGNITDRRNPARPSDTLHASVYRNAAYTIPTAQAALAMDTVRFDPSGMFTTGALKVPVAGVYQVSVMITASQSINGLVAIFVQQNGVNVAQSNVYAAAAGAFVSPSLSWPFKAAAGDAFNMGVLAQPAAAIATGLVGNTLSASYLGTG